MSLTVEFTPLALDDLRRECAYLKAEHWRFVQMLAALNDADGADLYYAFMKDGCLRNYCVAGVTKEEVVPSITDLFLAAFVFENEARELFGVNMGPIAIDFAGKMYAPAEDEPMTFISPEQMAAREKARKAAEAKALKEKMSVENRVEGVIEVAPAAGGVDATGKAEKTAAPSTSRALSAAQVALIKQKITELPPAKAAKLQAVLDLNAMAVIDERQNTAERVEGFTPNAVVSDNPVVQNKHDIVVDAEKQEHEPVAMVIEDMDLDKMLSLMDEDRAAIVVAALKNERA